MWDEILGHEQNKAFLKQLLLPGQRPHALLFYGPEGIGKRSLALRFTKTLLCLNAQGNDACEKCESCRLLNLREESYSHTDFIFIQQEAIGKDIKIDQVKEMTAQAAYAPVLSKHKICIIDAADKMTVEAANSLLKLLEEPPNNWIFILLASQIDRLLPTILSRVIQLRFEPLPINLTVQALQERGMIELQAELLARLSGGSLGGAINLAAVQVVEVRDQAVEFLSALPLKQPMQYLSSQGWLDALDRNKALLFVEMLLLLLRDCLLVQTGGEKQIYNCDITDKLRQLAADWNEVKLKDAAQMTQEAYRAIAANAGVKLVLETIVLKTDRFWKEER